MFTNTRVNSVAFTPEEIKQGLHIDLLDYLISHNQKNKNSYYDIHITTDGFCTIVEFATITYGIDDGVEGFVFMDEEHELLKRVEFPDGHYDYFNDDEVDDAFKKWLADHPEWYKDTNNHWHHKYLEEMLDDGCVYGDTDGDRKVYAALMEDDDE